MCVHIQLSNKRKLSFILSLCYYLRTQILHTGRFLSSLLLNIYCL